MHPIYTLNARGHILLEIVRDHFGLSGTRMRREILAMHQDTVKILKSKGIRYEELRSGLIPRSDKQEAAFIFDSTKIDDGAYGRQVFLKLLPLLESKGVQSILAGDFLCNDQDLAFEILQNSLIIANPPFIFQHSTLLFCVYINNLSDTELSRLHSCLSSYAAYVGCIPTTYQTRAKTLLSLSMANVCLKKGRTVIMPHEEDRDDRENVNITLYPFNECNLRVISINSSSFGIFLSYKVERASLGRTGEIDTEMGLNALSNEVFPLAGFNVQIDPEKLSYVLTHKEGKMGMAGLAQADSEKIGSIIISKIKESYIYDLHLNEYNVAKFNLMLQLNGRRGDPVKLTAVLEYRPNEKILRLITLF